MAQAMTMKLNCLLGEIRELAGEVLSADFVIETTDHDTLLEILKMFRQRVGKFVSLS